MLSRRLSNSVAIVFCLSQLSLPSSSSLNAADHDYPAEPNVEHVEHNVSAAEHKGDLAEHKVGAAEHKVDLAEYKVDPVEHSIEAAGHADGQTEHNFEQSQHGADQVQVEHRFQSEHSSSQLEIGNSTISIKIVGTLPTELKSKAINWVSNSASAVARYYGHFPVRHLDVTLRARSGHGFGLGTADLIHSKPNINLPLGIETSDSELHDDWVLTHEMVHLAFPLVDREDRWLVEGMATYVEPFARLQFGSLSAKEVWGDFVKSGPRGLAKNSDEILRGSRRIPRIYWGGATFCLLADLQLRQESKNKYGLQDLLSAISSSGVNIKSHLSARRALSVGDKAFGIKTLEQLYDKMSLSADRPDLEKIFAQLGIVSEAGEVKFDDSAPLANIRRSLEAGKISDSNNH
jgi:hypothetical protein